MENEINKVDMKPIYNEKVKDIIKGFMEGKSLEEIAKSLGYSNIRSMGIYMHRKNFQFNKSKGNYEPIVAARNETIVELPTSSKVANAIQFLSKEGADIRATAKRLGFKDHRDMASFMKCKGYVYDTDIKNYVKKKGEIIIKEDVENLEGRPTNFDCNNGVSLLDDDKNDLKELLNSDHADEYLNILEMLLKNKDKLVDFLMPELQNGKIPRFTVGGTFVTKSVHMSNLLDEMVREFSAEKNMSQREIFEVALIEFFRKYGYETAIETMFSM